MPIRTDGFAVLGIGAIDITRTRHTLEHSRPRNVTAFLEERITQGKADGFALFVALCRYAAAASVRAGMDVRGK